MARDSCGTAMGAGVHPGLHSCTLQSPPKTRVHKPCVLLPIQVSCGSSCRKFKILSIFVVYTLTVFSPCFPPTIVDTLKPLFSRSHIRAYKEWRKNHHGGFSDCCQCAGSLQRWLSSVYYWTKLCVGLHKINVTGFYIHHTCCKWMQGYIIMATYYEMPPQCAFVFRNHQVSKLFWRWNTGTCMHRSRVLSQEFGFQ